MNTRRVTVALLVFLAMGLGIAIWRQWPVADVAPEFRYRIAGTFERHPTQRWQSESVGPSSFHPRITNVQVIDYDDDGRPDILVCDAGLNCVRVLKASSAGWEPETIAELINAPAHAEVVDLDQDGDRDIVVAVLGDLFPSDERVGRVLLLENVEGKFVKRTLLDNIHRVADVQPADLDGDGDLDLAVAVFGYVHGEVLWLEQREPLSFRDHHLLDRPGTIHVPVGDYDGDGDLDIATVASQDEEEVWGLENDGAGNFTARRLWFTHNYDVGSGGLVRCDLDRDGDLDLLLPLGDNLEHGYGWPQGYHGCVWLENQGNWEFKASQLCSFGGTYAVAPGDFDGDDDTDLCLVSMSNDWNDPDHASAIWLENDGQQQFRSWEVATAPVELVTVASGDLNGDGRDDLVGGCLHIPSSALTRVQPVTSWLSTTD